MFDKLYDVIVVGAGHAGNEAAHAASKMGSKTLLITMNLGTVGQMSCNPAMGGIAKGQIVREIDALGGMSGIVSDKSAIQMRMLNRSKGPAMWSPRSQNDRMLFAWEWRLALENSKNLDFFQDTVTDVLTENGKITGVKTGLGLIFKAKSVVLTNGTFLNGLIHIGRKNFGGGRSGESAAVGLTKSLLELGFVSDRMKTGTPPRVDGRSLDYSKMEAQHGDPEHLQFSYRLKDYKKLKQLPCYITYTNNNVHETLKEGFDDSPMFNGSIQSTGPRYCPSIEDKINRFAERERHQIFVEPEGVDTVETYINGFSTSLPEDVQMRAIQLIPGFENAKIFRPGYAIEYDYFPPTQLKHTLETKLVENLYFAGQINGTTGYEEAGSQGLMAGINAHLKNVEKEPLILGRDQAYIGVLIDDLITKGTEEPYRMFTSRAEYRLLLRQDNADQRLSEFGKNIGLLDDAFYKEMNAKYDRISSGIAAVEKTSIAPEEINSMLSSIESAPITQKVKSDTVLSRPNVHITDIINASEDLKNHEDILKLNKEELESAEIRIKYKGYLQKESDAATKLKHLDKVRIDADFNYKNVKSLSTEAIEKLSEIKPINLAQASRISGVSPSDISILLIQMKK